MMTDERLAQIKRRRQKAASIYLPEMRDIIDDLVAEVDRQRAEREKFVKVVDGLCEKISWLQSLAGTEWMYREGAPTYALMRELGVEQ